MTKTVILNWLYNVATAISQSINAIVFLGDPAESLSSRIGKSIEAKGWASRVPWPEFARAHFLRSVTPDRGHNTAWTRQSRP